LNFLFLDPNIDETGNQLYKSNHGPSECCYDYCTNTNGLCSSNCDAIFNETAINAAVDDDNTSKRHNDTKSDKMPNLFVKLNNGTYVLNDYSSMPESNEMQCPVLPNITQSTQQCSISQANAAVASSAANSLFYPSTSITSALKALNNNNNNLHLNLVITKINSSIVASHWMNLVWNSLKFIALQITLLQLATGS
jgi:hypothetical protein